MAIKDKKAIAPYSAAFSIYIKVFKPLKANLVISPALLTYLYALVARELIGGIP
jgi:hypothetical protein